MRVNIRNKKNIQVMIFVFITIITLSVGYATISAINLVINGNATASVNQSNFSVVFKSASVTPGKGTATINDQDETIAYFDVSGLSAAGDTAVATYTIKNESNGIGADIGLKIENTNSEYFQVTESIADNKLQSNEQTTATVTVEMIKTPIESSVTTSVTGRLIATPLENESATGGTSATKVAGAPDSFAEDSWATIQKAVQDNNTSAYNIGDTKEVTINNTDYTVRLVNKTTGSNCGDNDTAYSQTACGFVVEFVDIVYKSKMYDSNTNIGGYPSSKVYNYLKNTLYGNLPQELQSVIKPTRVISGVGCVGSWSAQSQTCSELDNSGNNYSTTDNLYLLSTSEVGTSTSHDTSNGTSHQLEYYVGKTRTDYIKQYNSSDTGWWLRSVKSADKYSFHGYNDLGNWCDFLGNNNYGIAPAFRIG